MQGQHELPEVNGAAVVGVEGPEDVLTEFVGIPIGEHLAVHGHKLILGQLPAGTILQESLVPLLETESSYSLSLCQNTTRFITKISSELFFVFFIRKFKSSSEIVFLLDLPPILKLYLQSM